MERRNDGTADGTAISKYIGQGSRRNSNKLDRTTERPTIRANQCSAFNCESVDSLLNSSTTVHGVPSGFEYLSVNYRPTVGCHSRPIYLLIVVPSAVPSYRLVLGKPLGEGHTDNFQM